MSEELVDDVVESEGRNSMTDLLENADDRDVKMILGDRYRIRPAGRIRPGIKAPVGTCSPEQKALYKKLFAEHVGFDTIDTEMLKLEPKGSSRKSCLRPANCDFFVVNDSDFSRPSDAELIRSRYADADGCVRRIPVWFSASERHRAIPHAFTAFDMGGNLRCVSFYDGDRLKFRYLPREVKVAKTEDWRILDSDDEDEATKACGLKVSLTGAYHVQIPGVRSVGGVLVNTKSWFGLSDALAVLREVRRILGRFDGLFNGEPFLELVKVQQTMKVDGKTTKQWIVTLELSVDMMELARYAEPQRVASRGLAAIRVLSGSPAQRPEPVPAVAPASDPLPEVPVAPVEEQKPDNSAGIKALHDFVGEVGLSAQQFDVWVAFMADGVAIEDHSVESLKVLYRSVRDRIKNDQAGFVAEVQDIARSVK